MAVLDVDRPDSWPDDIRAEADRWACELRGTTTASAELDIPSEVFQDVLSAHLFTAYHCTRLLPHEIASVRNKGLRVATEETTRERITRAFEAGELTAEERDHLYQRHIFAPRDPFQCTIRSGQVCLFLSRQLFGHINHEWLAKWGGEVLHGLIDAVVNAQKLTLSTLKN